MIKEGKGHHPHSLRDPKPIADWIEGNSHRNEGEPPKFVGAKSTRTSFYGSENIYREFPSEGCYVTCRGPGFVPSYDRYSFSIDGVEGNVTVIAPHKAATGNPWVYRSDLVERDSTVDLALLANGYHIVTGPVPYNSDGPTLAHWNAVYQYLVSKGFAKKLVLMGRGGAAGDAYAWAIANTDKVSCIYVENPLLRSKMAGAPLLESLAPLATAGIPVLHLCGELDPILKGNPESLSNSLRR
jgi:hypothetical protein